ncbi:hypothetical protein [uncultured Gimesia sp.]|uniref:hypothetical protein n=1 Tax=uncultured Gimesia sp. TaxID=1678688 RepID=UPI0030D9121D|tara:strand:+ start:96356 stop:96802 length:447 start_codon:yes stop_codon:yes gene_type:complete
MSQARAFIPDGYTQDCLINELPGIHEVVRFKFRPVLPEPIRALMHSYFDKSAKQQGDIVNQTLIRQLVEWDLRDHESESVALTVENLQRIKKPLKDRLFNIVTCYEAGDEAESAKVEEQGDALDFDKILSGEADSSVKFSLQEQDAKN